MDSDSIQSVEPSRENQQDALEVAKHLVDISQLLIDNVEENPNFVVIDKDHASRTAIRVEDEHVVFASKYKSLFHRNSQELVFGSCIEFARRNEDKYREFLTNYQAESFKENLSDTLEQQSEEENLDPSQESNSSDDEITSEPTLESEPSFEAAFEEPREDEQRW